MATFQEGHQQAKLDSFPNIRYWGKKPPALIKDFIRKYSSSGEVVLDPFGGSGNIIATALSLGRRGIYVDLNPFAKLISKARITKCTLEELKENQAKITGENLKVEVNGEEKEINPKTLFSLKCPCGEWNEFKSIVKTREYQIRNSIPSDATKLRKSVYNELRREEKIFHEDLVEKFPNKPNYVISGAVTWLKNNDVIREDIVTTYAKLKRKCECGRSEINFKDKNDIQWKYKKVKPLYWVPENNLQYSKDKSFLKQRDYDSVDGFVNDRTLAFLSNIWKNIEELKVSKRAKRVMKFAFMNTLARSSKMCREGGGTWPVNSYWVPPRFKIKNPRYVLRRTFKNIEDSIKNDKNLYREGSLSEIVEQKANICFLQADSKNLQVPDSSIEYVITDPPHAGEVQFLELSLFYNSWLKVDVGYSNELTINSKQGKSIENYYQMFSKFVDEMKRVLKENGNITIILQADKEDIQESCVEIMKNSGFNLRDCRKSNNFSFYTFDLE